MKIFAVLLFASLLYGGQAMAWNNRHKELIGAGGNTIMRVCQITEHGDSLLLRKKSKQLTRSELNTGEFAALASRMLLTVQDPQMPGVGIAAPQVGVLRRFVIVQRFDKEGEPFEQYVNPRIELYSGIRGEGGEGCLSVPQLRGTVERSKAILLSYFDPHSGRRVHEIVTGFTAVIFQHEIDHLDGVIYTDRASRIIPDK